MKPYLLGIDIGTSACKVAVFEKSGTVVAAANGDYPVYYPKEGWAEQNPEEWWSAVCQAVKKVIEKAGIQPEEIAGIGIDGQSWSAIAMDKDLTKRVVAPLGVKTPAWMLVESDGMDIDAVCAQAKLPCVVKPDDSGSSIGVSIANDEAELRAALKAAANEGSRILIEQYICGREVQIGILGDKALPSIEIIPAEGFYDYRNKYQPGAAREITPAEIPAETEQRLADAALTVFHALNLSAYSRADFILDAEGELWFLEINTLPGMTPTSLVPQEAAAVGISYSELCEQIIADALHK